MSRGEKKINEESPYLKRPNFKRKKERQRNKCTFDFDKNNQLYW